MDAVLVGGLALDGLLGLVTTPLVPALVGTNPVLLEAVQGGIASMVAAGAFARVGRAALWLVVLAPVPGLMLFDPLMWWAGRRYGAAAVGWYLRRQPRRARVVVRAERAFARWGGLSIVAAYFLPIPNALLYVLAGTTGMPLWWFLALDGAGTLLFVGTVVGLGYALGRPGVAVATTVSQFAVAITVGLVLALVAMAVWRARGTRRVRLPP